jgi:hypothetical protein
MDDLYLLMAFARRAAEASLQGWDDPTLRDGLTAVGLVDIERVDFRDAIVASELIAWAMKQADIDYSGEFARVAERAESGMADVLRKVAARPPAQVGPGMSQAVAAPVGTVLAESDFERWEPTVDLVAIAFDIADVIEADVYRCTRLTVSQTLPEFWLRAGNDPSAVAIALDRTRAVLSIRASLDRSVCPTSDSQMFVTWVCEAADERDAAMLARAAKPGSTYAAFGIAHQRVACIVVARSLVEGNDAYESAKSLMRLAAPVTRAIETGMARR